ncbi:MAG TPA: MFS transporter, partial [Tenuifilaceae bacterium]|nr:MFS transporter [Tenuifilaceae bacterium]
MNRKTFPILLAFLCMGFGDAVGPFVGLAKEQFALSNFEAQLIAFMGFIMFGLLSVPMGIV